MYQSEQINELMSALSKAQGKISKAEKTAVNPFFKSKYADLDSVWSACKGPLTENGLSITQTMGYAENGDHCLVTQLSHSSGQWIRSIIPIKIDAALPGEKTNYTQKLGSCLTYLRRYSLSSIVGVGGDVDDDGNSLNTEPRESTSSKKILPTQVNELLSLMDLVPNDFRKVVWEGLMKRGFKRIEDLPAEMFEALKKTLKDNVPQETEEAPF